MEAKLGFDRGFGHLTLVQFGHGGRKLRHVAARIGPIQIAAIGAGAWVFGGFLGEFFKTATFFDLCDQGQGFVFFFHQDVASAVLLATVGRDKLVVFGFDFGIGHWIFLLKVSEQLTDQNRLARQFELVFVVFGGIQTALAGFLHEHFAGDQLFFDLTHHFRRHGAA